MERPLWLRHENAGKRVDRHPGPVRPPNIDTQGIQRRQVVYEAGLCRPEPGRVCRRGRDVPQGSARGLRQPQPAGQQHAEVLAENEHAVWRYSFQSVSRKCSCICCGVSRL